MRKTFYIGLLALILTSCKTQKDIIETNNELNSNLKKEKIFSNIRKAIDFSTLKIKATANIESGNTNYPAVALTLYLEKGEKIWANASLAFFMIARANITPTGFKMYEKPGKTYLDSDFSYVNKMLKIDFLDYKSIEYLLLGKLFFPVKSSDFNLSFSDGNYVFTSIKPLQIGQGKKSQNFDRKISYDSNFNLKQVILEDKSSNSFLQVDYGDYIQYDDNIFPKNIKIFIKEKKESKISLDYNKFETVKMETPFEIPKGYSQREFK